MNVPCEIISTGSNGNAVIINDCVLVDCGVSYKELAPYISRIQAVLLTHIHSDHFKPSTIRLIAQNRPTVRFICGYWMTRHLLDIGINGKHIDVLNDGKRYAYNGFILSPFRLVHNAENFGWKIHFAEGYKVIYATDTGSLNGVVAKNYDLYLIEANHHEDEIKARIAEKEKRGEYAYERRAMYNHLSIEKAADWLYQNMGVNSTYYYMHGHID